MDPWYDEIIRTNLSDEKLNELRTISAGINSYPFAPLVPRLETLKQILLAVTEALEFLTFDLRQDVDQKLQEINQAMYQMAKFDAMKITDAARVAENLVTSTSSNINYVINKLLPVAGMRNQRTDLAEYETELKDFRNQYLQTIELTRASQANIGTNDAAEFFSKLKNTYDRFSAWYLVGMVGSLVLTIIYSERWHTDLLTTLKTLEPHVTVTDRYAADLPYLSILAVAWFAIRFFARNFRNAQHLKILNDTKATILKTGLYFSNSVSDPATQNLILRATFESTLTIGDTAYLTNESDGPSIENAALISILKSIVQKP